MILTAKAGETRYDMNTIELDLAGARPDVIEDMRREIESRIIYAIRANKVLWHSSIQEFKFSYLGVVYKVTLHDGTTVLSFIKYGTVATDDDGEDYLDLSPGQRREKECREKTYGDSWGSW